MSEKMLHPSFTGRGATAAEPACMYAQHAEGMLIDWPAAQRAERACCCPAKPAVIALMPPAPARPHTTDLLLCGHHYRMCRERLAQAGATVVDIAGAPVTGDAWSLAVTSA